MKAVTVAKEESKKWKKGARTNEDVIESIGRSIQDIVRGRIKEI